MHLNREQALTYLKETGYPMGKTTWYRWKVQLNHEKQKRLYEIARIGYEEEHTDSIEEIETARKLLWKEYHNCKGPVSRASILEKIINTRPLLSSYYDSTKEVIEKPVNQRTTIKEDNNIQITTTAERIPPVE
jgi:hypothetical protein